MTKDEQEEFLTKIAELWALVPHKSFGKFIFEVSKNQTELYILPDNELLKRLEKENKK